MYETINEILESSIGPSAGFQELVQPAPHVVGDDFIKLRSERLPIVREFFEKSIEILRMAVDGKLPFDVLDLLLGDARGDFNASSVRLLPPALLHAPLFSRTDESSSGKIMEFQCPGSGWGDCELLAQAYQESGLDLQDSASGRYVDAVRHLTRKHTPAVLQLLDSASAPVGMRFLISSTRPDLNYWGFDPGVRWGECDLVRAHTPFALMGENQINRRITQVINGDAFLDPPLHALFAQKATLALPFDPVTRDMFSDEVRDMIAYSAVLRKDGFVDEEGELVTIENFLRRPSRERRWFLKYSGSDIGMSWGGKSVFRLDSSDAKRRLEHALSYGPNRWILQPEVTEKETVAYITRTKEVRVEAMYAKFSTFYAPNSVIAIRSMHRKHFKIHGQSDTVVGMVRLDSPSGQPA